MKTTYKEIIDAKEALGKLLDRQLKVKEAISLARLVKNLNAELELFGEQQRKIMQGAATPSEKQVKQMQELLTLEVDLQGEKVSVTVDEIEAAVVIAAEPFITFEEGD